MAKEQWKKISVIAGLVSLIIVVAGGIYATGAMVVTVNAKNDATDLKVDTKTEANNLKIDTEIKSVTTSIKSVQENACEDRESVKQLAGIVSGMKVDHDEDYKELKESDHAAAMRDKEQAMHYSQILGHMSQQTAQNRVSNDRGRKMELDMAEIKVQMKTLIPE